MTAYPAFDSGLLATGFDDPADTVRMDPFPQNVVVGFVNFSEQGSAFDP